MAYTVTMPGGTTDHEFIRYVRLLRQTGKKLGNLPRVPDPEMPRHRWLHAWNARDEAQAFADELNDGTSGSRWQVEETAVPTSAGPFGPVLFQLARRSDGLGLALHPLSLAMIREASPGTSPAASSTFIDATTWADFRRDGKGLAELVADLAPNLTGLSMGRLTDLGYAVLDDDTDRTWVYVSPRLIAEQAIPHPV